MKGRVLSDTLQTTPITAEARIPSQAILYGICGGRVCSGKGSSSAAVRPRYSATVFLLQFVALYRRWWEMEVLCNSEFVFADFHGR
jgi:hypothetical protein